MTGYLGPCLFVGAYDSKSEHTERRALGMERFEATIFLRLKFVFNLYIHVV